MALFNDGPISTLIDLQQYEDAILTVASTENINLGTKITLAQQDLANELILFLLRRPYPFDGSFGFQQSRDVSNVVVTSQLRQWHVYRTLALVYRDAYNNQLNNRYQGKWTEYETLAKTSARMYFQIGVGLVADPVPQPAAPTLSMVPGTASGGTFYAAVTWVDTMGQEGSPSAFSQLGTSDGQQLVVSANDPPQDVPSWNVYVGTSLTTLSLQNTAPLATSSSWTMISGLAAGAPLPAGQLATWFIVDHRVIERG